jgi:hypothetical protein
MLLILTQGCKFYASVKPEGIKYYPSNPAEYTELVFNSSEVYSYKRFLWANHIQSDPNQLFSSDKKKILRLQANDTLVKKDNTKLAGDPRYIVDMQAMIFFPDSGIVLYLPSVGYKYLCKWHQNTPPENYDLDDVRKIRIGRYSINTTTYQTLMEFQEIDGTILKWWITGIPGNNGYEKHSVNPPKPYNSFLIDSVEHIDERSGKKETLSVNNFVFYTSGKPAKITQSSVECHCEDLELLDGCKIRFSNHTARTKLKQHMISFEMKNTTTNDPRDTRWNTFSGRVRALPPK